MHLFNKICGFGVIIFIAATSVSSQETNLTIPFNKVLTKNDHELYAEFILINGSAAVKVNFIDVSASLSFIIFQVHSHIHNVTLYKNKYVYGNIVTGTNIGLQSTAMSTDVYYVQNLKDIPLKLLIVIQGYGSKDPVPGGCNMEFPPDIAPYMIVNLYNKAYMHIDVGAPSIAAKGDINCLEIDRVFIYFYMIYLPEHNFDDDVYFGAIRNMTNEQYIEENGRMLYPTSTKYFTSRRVVSAYPGTGAVFVAIAKAYDEKYNHLGSSVYVPTHSYACSLLEEDCDMLGDTLSKIIYASVFLLSIFICYFGHTFFKIQIMSLGFMIGTILNYILLSLFYDMDHPARLAASSLCGICIGLLLLVFWWLYGLPIYVIVPFSLQIGFLAAALLYYVIPGYFIDYLVPDLNFWTIFIFIMLLITVFLITVSHIVNILCCSIAGGYAAIFCLDHFVGSNMKYILDNVVRRATLTEFKKALIVPPFQFNDWIQTMLWIALTVTGFWYQFYKNKGKPPFPPPPRSVRAYPEEPITPQYRRNYSIWRAFTMNDEERRPLLRNTNTTST